MNYLVKRYENYGNGFDLIHQSAFSDAESKVMVGHLKAEGYKRVKGSGIIGMTFENNDLEKNVQVTFERVID